VPAARLPAGPPLHARVDARGGAGRGPVGPRPPAGGDRVEGAGRQQRFVGRISNPFCEEDGLEIRPTGKAARQETRPPSRQPNGKVKFMPLTTTSLALLTGACVALCGLLLRRRRARGGGRAVFEVNPRYRDLLRRRGLGGPGDF